MNKIYLTINYLAMTFMQKGPFSIVQIKSLSLTKLKMGKQKYLTQEEKSTIVRCLAENLTKSVDNRLVKVLSNNGKYANI